MNKIISWFVANVAIYKITSELKNPYSFSHYPIVNSLPLPLSIAFNTPSLYGWKVW